MLKAISNLAFWNWSSLGKQNQIANCGLKSTSLCISLLISPPRFNIISAPFWYVPDVMPAITQVVMISSMFAVPTPSATSISYSTFMSWRNTKGTSRFFRKKNSFSLCLSGGIIVRNITDAHCDTAPLFWSWVVLSPYWESVCSVVQTVSVKLL